MPLIMSVPKRKLLNVNCGLLQSCSVEHPDDMRLAEEHLALKSSKDPRLCEGRFVSPLAVLDAQCTLVIGAWTTANAGIPPALIFVMLKHHWGRGCHIYLVFAPSIAVYWLGEGTTEPKSSSSGIERRGLHLPASPTLARILT